MAYCYHAGCEKQPAFCFPAMNGDPERELKPSPAMDTRSTSFVVRIYLVGAPPGPYARWYGTIEHVQSSEQLVFRELARMNLFIANHSGLILPAAETTAPRLGMPALFAWLRRWLRLKR